MFARHITLLLRPNVAKELTVTFEKEILPLLKKQKGFVDELLLVTPEKKQVVAISLWEKKENGGNLQSGTLSRGRKDAGEIHRGISDHQELRSGIFHVPQDCLRSNGLIPIFGFTARVAQQSHLGG
jgi:hypothetical protein